MDAKSEKFDEETVKFLGGLPFFQRLPDAERDEVIAACKLIDCSMGDVVCKEGDYADCMYIVHSGSIDIWWNYDKLGYEILLGTFAKGHVFGEMALLDNSPRSATVVARTKLKLIVLHVDDFHFFLNKSTSLARTLLLLLSGVMRTSNGIFTAHLHKQNKELEQAYKELKHTQRSLLRNERLANLGKVSSLIAHDIRNPISVIKCYVQLLLSQYDNPSQVQSYGHALQSGVERLEEIAGDILDYSRGKVSLNVTIVKLNEFVNTLKEQVTPEMNAEGIEFTIVSSPNEIHFFADQSKLRRAIVNLLDNSRKACQRGRKVSLTIQDNGKMLDFQIADTGTGMSKDVLEHILDPFYSASEKGGYGLGMVGAQAGIEAHGGKLLIESTVEVGTTIKFSIQKQP